MSDDEFFYDMLRQGSGPVPRLRRRRNESDVTFATHLAPPEPPRRRRRSGAAAIRCDFSAAAIGRSALAVVTLRPSRDGELVIDPARTRLFELRGREQPDLDALHHEVQFFFFSNGIRSVALRSAPAKGRYLAQASTYKIEAILQLVDLLRVDLLASSTVSSWIARARPVLPMPQAGLTKLDGELQYRAIEAAAHLECAGRDLTSISILKALLHG